MTYKLSYTETKVHPGYDTIDLKLGAARCNDYSVNLTIEDAQKIIDDLADKIIEAKRERIKIYQDTVTTATAQVEQNLEYIKKNE